MNPFVYYTIAAILFVLGLAAIGGATFGKQRNRRVVLAVAGVALWAATLLVYSRLRRWPRSSRSLRRQ